MAYEVRISTKGAPKHFTKWIRYETRAEMIEAVEALKEHGWTVKVRPVGDRNPMSAKITVKKTAMKKDPLTGVAAETIWGVYRGSKLIYTSPYKDRATRQAAESREVNKKRASKVNPTKSPRKVRRASTGPTSKHYVIKTYGEGGAFLGNVSGRGTLANAENRAHKLCKGKVRKVVLDF
jgi:hypothetical protein